MPKKAPKEKPSRRRRPAPRKAAKKGFLSMISNPAGELGGAGAAFKSILPAVGAYGATRVAAKAIPAVLFRPRATQDEQQRVVEVQRALNRRRKAAPVVALSTLVFLYFLAKKWSKLKDHQKSIFIGSLIGAVHTVVQCWAPKLGKLVGIHTPPQIRPAQQQQPARRPTTFVDPTFGYSDADLDAIEAEAEILYGRRRVQYDDVRGNSPDPRFPRGVAPDEVYEQPNVPPLQQTPPGMSQAAQSNWEVEAALSGSDEHPDLDMGGVDPRWSGYN